MNTSRQRPLFLTAMGVILATFCHAAAPASPATSASDAPSADSQEDALELRRRYQRFVSDTGHKMPSDVSTVLAGTDNYSPLPKAAAPTISASNLMVAANYYVERNSTAFLVWRSGALEWEQYFGDNNSQSLFDAKSLGKPMGVIAVGRAIAEGYIDSLDQPASEFITEWKGTPKAGILVRHLLDMRSGLKPQEEIRSEGPNHPNARAYLHPRHEEVIVNEYPLVNPPGARYDYAGPNSALVGVLIERATGEAYENWLSREVLVPLGARGGRIWMNREGGMPHAGCCTLLPADSFLRPALLLMSDGVWQGVRLLPEGFVQQMRTPTLQNPHAGMGLYVAGPYTPWRGPLNPDQTLGRIFHSEPYLADDLFLFDGNQRQVVYMIPSAQLVILRLGQWPPRGVDWDHTVVPNSLLRGIDFAPGQAPTPQR